MLCVKVHAKIFVKQTQIGLLYFLMSSCEINIWSNSPNPPSFLDVLRFDNTYSFIHAKKVSYTVEVLLPDRSSEEKIQKLEEKLETSLSL